jgi:fermentation-respiration switch protein FrsA (DUF1100 family)
MSQGLRCAGWLYLPENFPAGKKAPAIVMAHGFSAVKEMYLPNFAERFTEAGFITLVFDYRYLGDSEGEPRGQIFPMEQIEDYRNAITWISDHPQVDPDRIGVWGTSYSGAHVLHLAAFDKRIKAVVSQVPLVNGWNNALRLNRPDHFVQFLNFLIQDRIQRYKTGQVNYLKVVAPEGEPSVLPTPESYQWFTQAGNTLAPNWRNQVTVESLEKFLEYDPAGSIHLISPTPLLMVVAGYDTLTPTDLAVAAYERALQPKAISIQPCKHFDAYTEPWVSKTAGVAVDWFKQHLA